MRTERVFLCFSKSNTISKSSLKEYTHSYIIVMLDVKVILEGGDAIKKDKVNYLQEKWEE